MPKRTGNRWIACVLPLWYALTGCDPLHRGCACSEDMRANVCVQGKYAGMDSVAYRRERANGAVDTLPLGDRGCFFELSGRQRVLVLKNGARIDSSAWFSLQTIECCHAEGKTVTF